MGIHAGGNIVRDVSQPGLGSGNERHTLDFQGSKRAVQVCKKVMFD